MVQNALKEEKKSLAFTKPIPNKPPKMAIANPKADYRQRHFAWMWPAEGKVVSKFSSQTNGIQINNKAGTPVRAITDGEVVYSGSGLRGYGNLIIIKHDKDFLSAYAHNRKLLVAEGTKVRAGQQIAEMGETDSHTTNLHFELRHHGKPIDPLSLLPTR